VKNIVKDVKIRGGEGRRQIEGGDRGTGARRRQEGKKKEDEEIKEKKRRGRIG